MALKLLLQVLFHLARARQEAFTCMSFHFKHLLVVKNVCGGKQKQCNPCFHLVLGELPVVVEVHLLEGLV